MATSTSKSTPVKGETAKHQDAIALLTADHKAVKALFKEFEQLTEQDDADEQKAALVEKICNELTVHAQLEEQIFYPTVREAIDDDSLMDEADVEHASAKDLIAQLEGMSPGDDHYDAMVVVLGEYINHHVEEEEGEMFVKARKSDVDTAALGIELAALKDELKSELGIEDDSHQVPSKRESGNGSKKATSAARK
jgi:hemerythrin-like domain-containing protein